MRYGGGNVNTFYRQDMKLTTERVKVLKVIGEKVAQVVLENEVPINAIKIDKIEASLRSVEDHVFDNKVVKQGIIHKQIFYVDPDNFLRHTAEDLPFMITVDIPGIKPGPFVDVQNHLLDVDVDFQLNHGCPGELAKLKQKVVAHILVKVSEWTQLDVVVDAKVFPKVNTVQRSFRCFSKY
jgi:predicted amidohydrolase